MQVIIFIIILYSALHIFNSAFNNRAFSFNCQNL